MISVSLYLYLFLPLHFPCISFPSFSISILFFLYIYQSIFISITQSIFPLLYLSIYQLNFFFYQGRDAQREGRGMEGDGRERRAQARLHPVRAHQGRKVQLQSQVQNVQCTAILYITFFDAISSP